MGWTSTPAPVIDSSSRVSASRRRKAIAHERAFAIRITHTVEVGRRTRGAVGVFAVCGIDEFRASFGSSRTTALGGLRPWGSRDCGGCPVPGPEDESGRRLL